MSRTAMIIIGVGLALIAVFGLADVIGIGGNEETFGGRQVVGTGFGAVLVIVGAVVGFIQSRAAHHENVP